MKHVRQMRKTIRKHRNLLFTLGEIGLATGAVIFAAKETPKFQRYLEEDEQPVKAFTKSYWPAAACYAGFITLRIFDCVSTTKIQRDYSAALLGLGSVAAGVSQNKITGLPEEKREAIHTEIKDSGKDYKLFYFDEDLPQLAEISKNGPTPGNDDFFYIPQFDILVCSNMHDIQNAEEKSRLRYESNATTYLNDILDDMGVKKKGFGADYYIPGQDQDFGESNEPFTYDISPAMTVSDLDESVLFYVINFNKKWKTVYDVD